MDSEIRAGKRLRAKGMKLRNDGRRTGPDDTDSTLQFNEVSHWDRQERHIGVDRKVTEYMATTHQRFGSAQALGISAVPLALLFAVALQAQPNAFKLSDRPGTPFKLATFEADGKLQVGLVFGSR